ncbi:MAG TPA: LssY C-terminal domain-containing protein [Alphaproteobacteria bacterium]|nr:LssY C-terminal domain-containing protein [Alphaproteobacteria bacterium]
MTRFVWHQRQKLWKVAAIIGVVVGGYTCLAYLILPALWRHYEHNPALATVPLVTRTAAGIPGDPINVALVGTDPEVVAALTAAGWRPAQPISLPSGLGIVESVLLQRPDPTAPVSNLYLWGRHQDLAFEQEAGSSARERHHVRFWRTDALGDGTRPLWIGAATFDRSVGLSHRTGQITHHIAPDLDAERDKLIADLAAEGRLTIIYRVSGIGPTLSGRNGGGDRYFTDGDITVGVLTVGGGVATRRVEQLPTPPAVKVKNHLWSWLRPLLD